MFVLGHSASDYNQDCMGFAPRTGHPFLGPDSLKGVVSAKTGKIRVFLFAEKKIEVTNGAC